MIPVQRAQAESPGRRVMIVEPGAIARRGWLREVWSYRALLSILARSDFHTRYKRASFGVLWAVAVPAIQAAALAVVFSRFVPVGGEFSYAAFAVSGVLAWAYFGQTLGTASTAIVEGSDLADKVWFPRALLVFVPCLANLPGLVISLVIYVGILPLLGGSIGLHTLLLIPAGILLVVFTSSLSMVLAALHVYFRDVRYLVQAALLVLFYLTPIVYPQTAVGALGPWLDLNPLTGVANLFHWGAVGTPEAWSTSAVRSIAIAVAATLGLLVAAIEIHRRRDRLFVDLL